MSFAKEKTKLEKLLKAVYTVTTYDEESFEILNQAYLEYAVIIRVLYKREPNTFANLFKYDLRKIRENKKFTKDSYSDDARQVNFMDYKDSIVQAAERTVEFITDYFQ